MCPGAQKCLKYCIKHFEFNQSKADYPMVLVQLHIRCCVQVLASQYRKDIKNIKMCPKEGNKHENTYQLSKEMGKGAHLLLGFFFSWHKTCLSHGRDQGVTQQQKHQMLWCEMFLLL